MSRLKKFSRNLAASYLQLGVNVVYSLVSIPLILHWLPRAEFGLWAVLVQLMGYVSIIDLGMTSAVARLLVDHKDERAGGNYGSLVKTAFFVSIVQGLIILAAVALAAPVLTHLMKVPVEYQSTFIILLRAQGAITAFTFALRPLGLTLEAHQRMDVLAYYTMFSLVSQLGLLILFLIKGCGIYSFIYANIISTLISPAYLVWNCRRLGVMPKAGEWGVLSWKKFREVFSFGADVFLFNLGGQLIMSSQTIIVTRCLGLDAAAVWSVGTKVFNLCVPLVMRPLYMSMPALAEMIVRGEQARLRSRFDGLVVLTGSIGVFMGISYALCNSLFVGIWTHNRIDWMSLNDVLLAAWLILISFQTVHCNFTFIVKQIGGMRYILFLEGCAFILLAGLTGSYSGMAGIIICSIICNAAFSFQYGVRRSVHYFQYKFWEALLRWLRPSLTFAVVYGLAASAIWVAGAGLPALARLSLNAVAALAVGGPLFVMLGCPAEIILEILDRLPHRISVYLRPVFMLASARRYGVLKNKL
jgi:O-antigen/teichoic acid export membrane protein